MRKPTATLINRKDIKQLKVFIITVSKLVVIYTRLLVNSNSLPWSCCMITGTP